MATQQVADQVVVKQWVTYICTIITILLSCLLLNLFFRKTSKPESSLTGSTPNNERFRIESQCYSWKTIVFAQAALVLVHTGREADLQTYLPANLMLLLVCCVNTPNTSNRFHCLLGAFFARCPHPVCLGVFWTNLWLLTHILLCVSFAVCRSCPRRQRAVITW